MKKSLFALAVLGSVASVASAQSSVTVYGKIDVGVVVEGGNVTPGADFGKSTLKVTSGVSAGSRLGFRGDEDLGGGLKERFQLETGLCADGTSAAADFCTGSNRFVGRTAIVALDGSFGSVVLGRKYAPAYIHLDRVDPFSSGLAGSVKNIFPFKDRLNNAIYYSIPNLGGVDASLAYSAGEKVGSTAAGRTTDASVSYTAGPLYVGAAYDEQNDATGATDVKLTNLGGTYDFGVAKAHLMLQQSKSAVAASESDTSLIGVTVPLGPGNLLASYINFNDKKAANKDATQFGIGYLVPLSKRTQLYTAYAKINNKNGAVKTVGNATEFGSAASGDKAFNVGVAHNF